MTPIDLQTLNIGDRFLDKDGGLCVYLGYANEAIVYEEIDNPDYQEGDHIFYVAWTKQARIYMTYYAGSWVQLEFKDGEEFYSLNKSAIDLSHELRAGFSEKEWRCI